MEKIIFKAIKESTLRAIRSVPDVNKMIILLNAQLKWYTANKEMLKNE